MAGRGDEGNLEKVAYGVGAGVLTLWVVLGVLFVRLRMVERMVRARLLEAGVHGCHGTNCNNAGIDLLPLAL